MEVRVRSRSTRRHRHHHTKPCNSRSLPIEPPNPSTIGRLLRHRPDKPNTWSCGRLWIETRQRAHLGNRSDDRWLLGRRSRRTPSHNRSLSRSALEVRVNAEYSKPRKRIIRQAAREQLNVSNGTRRAQRPSNEAFRAEWRRRFQAKKRQREASCQN